MDKGAWWAAVHGVAESRTWLSDFTLTFYFRALEKEMATHSSVLAWRIPGTGEPCGLTSMGLHRVGHDWSDLAATAAVFPSPGNEYITVLQLFSSFTWNSQSQHLPGPCIFGEGAWAGVKVGEQERMRPTTLGLNEATKSHLIVPFSHQKWFGTLSHHHMVNVIPRLWWLKYPEKDFIVSVKQSDSTYGSWPILKQPESSHFLTAYEGEKKYKRK